MSLRLNWGYTKDLCCHISLFSGGRCCHIIYREGVLSELLHADDLFLAIETMEGLRNKSLKLKEAFESKGFKINLGKNQGNGQRRHHKGWLVKK